MVQVSKLKVTSSNIVVMRKSERLKAQIQIVDKNLTFLIHIISLLADLANNIIPLGEERYPVIQYTLLFLWQVFPISSYILFL